MDDERTYSLNEVAINWNATLVFLLADKLLPLYRPYGHEQDRHMELFDCVHEELSEMRGKILKWMNRYLVVRS